MHALLERKVVISNDDHFMIRFRNGRDSEGREREEKALRPICGYSREKGNYFPSVFPQVETDVVVGGLNVKYCRRKNIFDVRREQRRRRVLSY